MASIPQFYSHDYTFPGDFCQFPAPVVAAAGIDGGAMWDEESFPLFDNGTVLDIVPPESDVVPSVSMTSYSDQSQVSDMAVPTLPDFNMGLCGIINAGVQNFGGGYHPDVCDQFGEECGRFISDFRQFYPAAGDNWGIQNINPILPAIEESNIKVGRYSVEERKDRILRYLKKRNQRNFNKTIKYACRKTLADKRVRVRGRFARNNELCEEEMVMKKNNPHEEKELYYGDAIQIKDDEDSFLQEAMESLMYLPHILPDDIYGGRS